MTRETTASAARTPRVLMLDGSGSSGRLGMRPVKGLGSSLVWRNCWTWVRKGGGGGARGSSVRSTAEPLIWLLTTPSELLAKVKPRTQATKRTPTQLVTVPATESQVASRVLRVRTRAR